MICSHNLATVSSLPLALLYHLSTKNEQIQGFRFFFKIGGRKWPMEQKIVGHFLRWWTQAYQTSHSWHSGSIIYLHTDTATCMHICILTADYTVKPVVSSHSKKKTNYRNAGQKYCRMLLGELSAILSTFIKLPFVIKIFVLSFLEWLLKTGFTVLTTYMYFLFCGILRLAVRWIFLLKWDFFTTFHNYKGWVHWTQCLGKWWAIFWNHGTMTRAHHKSEGLLKFWFSFALLQLRLFVMMLYVPVSNISVTLGLFPVFLA